MPDGGELSIETANVEVRAKQAHEFGIAAGCYLTIVVADTGIGMSREVADRAFDPFFTTKGVGKGTGLGLSQVFGFVRQTGGHVTIDSALGEGTRIRLYLPRSEQAEAGRPHAEDTATIAGHAHETVLVVEDEDRVRAMAVEALQGLRYSVIETASPSEALEFVGTDRPITLLFTDIVMPQMNGGELAAQALMRSPTLKVLFTTGYAPDDNGHARLSGLEAKPLYKPYSIEQLSRRVRAAIDG
jgi:CheY-like chemotaxis protein